MPRPSGWRSRRDVRSGEAVPIGRIVDDLLDESVFKRGMPIARLVRSWPEVVGGRLAGETSPAELEAGVLTVVATDGPWGAQARFLHEAIMRNANETLGTDEVIRVRIVVRNSR